jgi:hypothetical protein
MPVNYTNVYKPTGWTANSIVPPTVQQPPINNALINPSTAVTPDTLQTTAPTGLVDPSLGSRAFMSLPAGYAQPLASASVYETPNAPAYLADQVANLNAQQAMRRTAQDDLVRQLLGGVAGGGENAYLYASALQAASAVPGSHLALPTIQNPAIGRGYLAQSNAAAARTTAQTRSINQAKFIQDEITRLQQQRTTPYLGGFSWGNDPVLARTDERIRNLRQQLPGAQSVAGNAAFGAGWVPMPSY